jgi:hypothetical protein
VSGAGTSGGTPDAAASDAAPGAGASDRAAVAGGADDWQATSLSAADNVATLLRGVSAGESVTVETPHERFVVVASEPIALCHKIALADIATGTRIVKYGECIGEAIAPIRRGAWVHTHNLRSLRARPSQQSTS